MLDIGDLITARDGARAADLVFQNIAFNILSIGREVPYLADGKPRRGRVAEHGTKGEWWRWTMVWLVDSVSGRKVRVDVVNIIQAIEREELTHAS